MTNLIFIGDKFYWESGTRMSCLYKESNGFYERYDWRFVKRDLENGEEVTIRPCTDTELGYFQRKLDQLKQKRLTECK